MVILDIFVQMDIQTNSDNSQILLLPDTIIDHVIMKASDGDFKNYKKNVSNHSLEERRIIAEETLNKSHLKFLNLFGEYLLEDHLEYFKGKNVDNYEINFHLHRLSRLINSKKVICKNRRYQAMLELLKGDYFSDNEMRNREPLLWEQLIGQYLTEEEKFHYENQFVAQNSLTEVLFEQIDRDNRDDLKRKQLIDEVQEPIEDDDENGDDGDDISNEPSNTTVVNSTSKLWGEYSKPKNETTEIGKHRWKKDHDINLEQCNNKKLSENERLLLLEEFRSHMIHKFLNGQEDFDYNNVDNNPEYDNLHIKGMDEEEKYFDSESPVEEIPPVENDTGDILFGENVSEEDELETYMSMLKKNEITDSVADKLKKL